MKKFISIAIAICLVFSLSVTALAADINTNGGSGSTPVYLSTTEDGSIDGTPAATAMSVTVPTVERGFLDVVFWSMEIAGESPSILSTLGFSICPKNCLA